ncbi:MAG: hypothetical protein ACREBN_06005 [Burkholderiaceae bacterium]
MTDLQSSHRHGVRSIVPMVLVLAVVTTAARADLIDIEWDGGGRFERTLTVAPGKFAELCTRLAKGQSVRWTFQADQPLSFNVHYHVGKDVVYAARDDRVRKQNGYLEVPQDQDYCWMWSNDTQVPASLKTALERG